MVARIKQLLDWQQLSPTQFADRIGVGRPVMSHILSERNKPSLEVARSIKAAFPEISFDWLLNGSGDMLVEPVLGMGPATSPPVGKVAAPVAGAAATVASAPAAVPTAVPVAPASSSASPAARQIKPVHPPSMPSGSTPVRFIPTDSNATGKVTPSSIESAAERFVVRGATPVPPAVAQPLPDVVLPPATASVVPAATTSGLAVPALAAAPGTAAPMAAATAQPAPAATEATAMAQALASGFNESSRVIRRIVIFYNDGSFADYKPEN